MNGDVLVFVVLLVMAVAVIGWLEYQLRRKRRVLLALITALVEQLFTGLWGERDLSTDREKEFVEFSHFAYKAIMFILWLDGAMPGLEKFGLDNEATFREIQWRLFLEHLAGEYSRDFGVYDMTEEESKTELRKIFNRIVAATPTTE